MPTVKFGGGKLMVWGCFSGMGTGSIQRVEGIMNQESYRNVLLNAMLHSAHKLFGVSDFWFQQDNAPCHKAASITTFLRQKKIRVIEWPPQSPDFNPIENLWQVMKRKVDAAKPQNVNALWDTIQDVWNSISQREIDSLLSSMPERIKLAIKARGGVTRF